MTMRIMVYIPLVLLLSVFTVSAQIEQTVEISSSPNPVGSGARALGMGGAFIGVADDATAASWNPGGLIQLETPEASIVGAYNFRREDTMYNAYPEASGPQDISTNVMYVSKEAYQRISKKINKLRDEVRSIAHKDTKPADRVYQLDILLFPNSKPPKKASS